MSNLRRCEILLPDESLLHPPDGVVFGVAIDIGVVGGESHNQHSRGIVDVAGGDGGSDGGGDGGSCARDGWEDSDGGGIGGGGVGELVEGGHVFAIDGKRFIVCIDGFHQIAQGTTIGSRDEEGGSRTAGFGLLLKGEGAIDFLVGIDHAGPADGTIGSFRRPRFVSIGHHGCVLRVEKQEHNDYVNKGSTG